MKKVKYFEISKKTLLEQIDVTETYEELQNSPNYQALRDALKRNKIVGVAYVKKDGTVRHMSMKRTLGAYEASDREKTPGQANLNAANDIKKVIDINIYKKALREFGGDKAKAAAAAWRSINLTTVLGFIFGTNFIDLREDNHILERFGEEVYNSLTPSMIREIEAQHAEDMAHEGEIDGGQEPAEINESRLNSIIKRVLRSKL